MTRTESTDLLDAADTPFELRVLEVALDVVRPRALPLHLRTASPCFVTRFHHNESQNSRYVWTSGDDCDAELLSRGRVEAAVRAATRVCA